MRTFIHEITRKIAGSFNSQLMAFVVLSIVIIAVFGRLTQTYYQQDEWNGMGLVFSEGINSIFPSTFKSIDLILIKGRLLSNLIFYFFAINYPLQNVQLAIFAIALHIIATFLVFLLIRRCVKSLYISLLGAIFFAVNAVSHGSVTWPVIAISTIGSSILILSGLIVFFKFLENSQSKFLLLAGLILYLSLWFKETGLYLFLFLPLAALLFKPYKFKTYLKQFWWFFIPFFLIVGYRVLELRFGPPDPNLYISSTSENFFLTILIRLVLYPLTSFSLMFVPGQPFIEFAREVLRDNYKFFANAPNDVLIAQSVILDLLAVILTGFLLFIVFLFARSDKAENIRKLIFWLTFTLLSFSPYVVLSKDFAYLESRYYYLPVVGAAVLFSWLLARVWATIGRKLFLMIILPLSLAFLFWHISTVRKAIEEQVVLSIWRREFISDVKNLVPNFDRNKNIFYINSDKNYWADGNMIPFQQGTGYTLMVLYYDSGKIPKEFLKDGYLFEIGSQGYKESGNLGFGFFWEEKELTQAAENYKIDPRSVIRLKYDSQKQNLGRLKND